MSPFDFVNSVSFTKVDLLKDEPEAVKNYVPFIVNKALSYFPDSVLHANEMNKSAHLRPEMQYSFLLNTLRKARRFSKWVKPEANENFRVVQLFYGYNPEKTRRALALLTAEQVQHIRTKVAASGEQYDGITKHG